MNLDTQFIARSLITPVEELRTRALALEALYEPQVQMIAPAYQPSARNLLHYLALRQSDIRQLQSELVTLGLSSLGRLEATTLVTLNAVLAALRSLAGEAVLGDDVSTPPVDFRSGPALLAEHTQSLLGAPSGKRSVRIMVTMPSEAADDVELVRNLLRMGMDVMRINCAHDGAEAWLKMIQHCRQAERELGRSCRIHIDLAGPKLRTGAIAPAGRIRRFQPRRDVRGHVVRPAQVLIVADDDAQIPSSANILPISRALADQVQLRDAFKMRDTRGRGRTLIVVQRTDSGWLAETRRTCYVETGLAVHLVRKGKVVADGSVGMLPEVVLPLLLREGNTLILTRDETPGEPAKLVGRVTAPAHIHCTLSAAFDAVLPGERIWFDDGKIGGIIADAESDRITVTITQAPPEGARLRSEKGINLPDTDIDIPSLTRKDRADLELLARYVDLVGLSFVQRPEDVKLLQSELQRLRADHLGIVLKVENRQAFDNLPLLLLTSLQRPPVGVMVARGDLAVELGFDRLAEVQEEILWLCEAAHVPVIWATQVLESMAKTGQPSRAEVSDAVMSGRAECVMLNKGPYIINAVQFLNGILERMDTHQSKKRSMLRKLAVSQVEMSE